MEWRRMHKRPYLLPVVLFALLLSLLGAPELSADPSAPSLTITPEVGPHETVFDITGSGWVPAELVSVEWFWPDGTSAGGRDFRADAKGDLDPSNWIAVAGEPSGVYTVEATGPASGKAVETFEVLPATSPILAAYSWMGGEVGDTFWIGGSGFQPAEKVALSLTDPATVTLDAEAGTEGDFYVLWDSAGSPQGTHTVTAVGDKGSTASTTFDLFPVRVLLPAILRNAGSGGAVPTAPTLDPIENSDGDGTYQVCWSSSAGATRYTLQEADNASFTGATAVYSGPAICWDASGKAAGTYYYRSNASNAQGTSAWSRTQSVVVQSSPSEPTPGLWQTPEGDIDIEFYVTSDRANVEDFTVSFYLEGCGRTITITNNLREPIVNNRFSFDTSDESFYGNGTFTTSTSCSGTAGLRGYYIPECRTTVFGGPWPYTATWQGTTEVPPDVGRVSVEVERADENAAESFLTAEMDSR